MKHAELITILPRYIDNDLPDEQYSEVEAHVATCEGCQAEIDRLLDEEPHPSRYTDGEILGLLRTGYTLSRSKERELIQRFQRVIADTLQSSPTDGFIPVSPVPPPLQEQRFQRVSPPSPPPQDLLELAADDGMEGKQREGIRRQVGLDLTQKRLQLFFSEEARYWVRLELHRDDINKAHLVFETNGQDTLELDGVEIEFYNTQTPEKTVTARIEEDCALLDFSKLDLSISDYEHVGFRLSFLDKVIESSLASLQ